ncbi:MAG: PDZ domain-containing protein [Bacilli bacterium]
MKIRKFLKNNYKFILLLLIMFAFFYLPLPYYIMAPGGTINITDRVEMDNYNAPSSGSLNMLYVSEYEATPAYMLYAKLNSNWDIEKNTERQVSNENPEEIEKRNKIMRDNSLDIATMVAYNEAGKNINIKSRENVVIATTIDNGLKVGDVIEKVEGEEATDVSDIKAIINNKNVGDYINFLVLRDEKEVNIKCKIVLEDNVKVIGVVIVTKYDYDVDPEIDIKFKNSESGSSGGLMLTLTIYNAISSEDIIKGRNIAGTGTISLDGTVGEIDGVKYKIMGAANNNMDLVLVPSANYDEAIETKEKYNYDMEIVKVDTFEEAIEYLESN